MTEMIVAAFDMPVPADAAVHDVESLALTSAVVRRYEKGDPEITGYRANDTKQSLWSWLFGSEPSPADQVVYDRSLEEGGIIVTVSCDERDAARVMDALNLHGPIDIEERAGQCGVSPATATVSTTVPAEVSTGARTDSRMATSSYDAMAGIPPATVPPATMREAGSARRATTGRTIAEGGEKVIPLAEEQLEVSKRKVDLGTTRIRRYVVSTPVEKPVTLHEERVTIERRRPVTPGAAGVPEGAFEERTTEVRTTSEEPVVTKTPRVAEEVVVHKQAQDKTEVVRDTVRREEVEVERTGTRKDRATETVLTMDQSAPRPDDSSSRPPAE